MFDGALATLLVAFAIYVATNPAAAYAPVQRLVVFSLLALVPALLFASTAQTKFEMALPGFCFTAGGAAAVVAGMLVLMVHLVRPEQRIAVYRFVDESGDDFSLERAGTCSTSTTFSQ